MTNVQMEQLQRTMVRQAYLFDDPYSYRCGVEDALDALRELLAAPHDGLAPPVSAAVS